jgi:hypothetical protein
VGGGMLIPGVTVTTDAPDDAFMGETVQLIQYDAAAAHFNDVGELIDFEGQTPDLTPSELISA